MTFVVALVAVEYFENSGGFMQTIREFLADEERALTTMVVVAAGLMVSGLVVAVWAMYPFT